MIFVVPDQYVEADSIGFGVLVFCYEGSTTLNTALIGYITPALPSGIDPEFHIRYALVLPKPCAPERLRFLMEQGRCHLRPSLSSAIPTMTGNTTPYLFLKRATVRKRQASGRPVTTYRVL